MLELVLSQLLALCAFFAFPVIQYLLLRAKLKNEAKCELWFLSDYCFRLVVRGIPAKKILSNLNFIVTIRKVIKPSKGSPVRTLVDDIVEVGSTLFLFPGTDKVLLCFRIESNGGEMALVITNKLGDELRRYTFESFDYIACDYLVTVKYLFHFNVSIGKRVIIKKTLSKLLL